MKNKTDKPDLSSPLADKPDEKYPLRTTSKSNVSRLADVCSKRLSITDQQRAKWAEQAGHQPSKMIPVERDRKTGKIKQSLTQAELEEADLKQEKKPCYDVEDVYTEYYVHAALAHAIFDGFPAIIEVKPAPDEESMPQIEILDQEKFDNLDEEVVNKAFLHYVSKRSGTSNLLNGFLNPSGGGLNNLLKQLGS